MKKKKLNSGHTVIQAFFCLHLMQRDGAIYQILRYGNKKNGTVMTGCGERDGG